MNEHKLPNVSARLQALAEYGILDSLAEREYDDLVRIAAHVCDTPVSLITFLDRDRQWFKAAVGTDIRETPLKQSICQHALGTGQFLHVSDTTQDERTQDNALVTHEPHVRFYAGAPIVTPDGIPLGTICVLDVKPRVLTPEQIDVLMALARQALSLLEARRMAARHLDRQRHLDTILASATDYAIIALDLDRRITDWNEGARRMLGWEPSEIVGLPIDIIFDAGDVSRGVPAEETSNAVTRGRGMDDRYHLRKDGSMFWASGEMMPLETDNGTITGYIKILRDETARREASEVQRIDAEFMRSLLGASPDCIVVLDLEGNTLFVSPGGIESMEITDVQAIIGLSWLRVWSGDDAERAKDALGVAARGGTGRFQGFRPTHKGTPKWWDVVISPLLGSDGKPERLLSIGRDISDAKRAEDRQRTLMQELAHRVKNTLAIVQAITGQTMRNATSLIEARHALSARLVAMAQAHDILVQASWTTASIRAITEGTARLLEDSARQRVSISGPDLALGPQAALSFALILHELGTNATKYGSLSKDDGRVIISWRQDDMEGDAHLRFRWQEVDGPPVVAPERKGFGSRLIEHSLASSLSATVELVFLPTGVTFTLDASLANLQQV